MDKSELIQKFNPANFASFTDEDNKALQNLTPDEIKILAQAYPNTARGNAYLRLKDVRKKETEQLYPASTFANLAELQRQGNKSFVIAGPSKDFRRKAEPTTAPIQDLTKEEAKNELSGVNASLQTGESQTATESQESTSQESEEDIALNKMLKADLQAKYKELFDEEAPADFTKEKLIAAIEAHGEQNK